MGFVGMQKSESVKTEPDILMDCGSTISLFKDDQFLRGVRAARRNLRMDTNAGSKLVCKEGNVPGYGPVYFDKCQCIIYFA